MKDTQHLVLIDGNALLYRAYFAFPKELSTSSGEIVGAVYGFTRILLATMRTLKPDCSAVCFDLPGPTFRHKSYPEYKATRQKMPEDLAGQIARAHQVVEYLEFPIYTAKSYEADDVIGTIAKRAVKENPNMRVTIVTGDQDIIQLVEERISVYTPAAYPKQPMLYTPQSVEEKYGFTPIQMIDYKALRGDPSDNIPGVPGIGEVTAKKLLTEFKSLENLYKELEAEKAESIKGAVREKLIKGKESAFQSYELATIHLDAPVQFDQVKSKLELQQPERLVALFRELGFRSLMKELPVSHALLTEATDIFSETEEKKTEAPAGELSESEKVDAEIAPILRDMEEYGVRLDVGYLVDLEKEYDLQIAEIKAELIKLAGEEFNPDSPQQVSHIFYEKLLIPTQFVRKGKTGYTTDAATLQELSEEYPIAALLLQYREIMKLQTTYARPLQDMVDTESRLHTSYAPDTATGRISSRNPNLQNIPVRSDQGKRLRRAFVATEGKVLLSADYSQMELRVAAHLSGDKTMIEMFKKGGDFHTQTAEKMGVDRHIAKIINFSILYGKGAFGFARDMNVSVAEAKQYIEDYFKTYSTLRTYLDSILETARKQGYLETMFGRRRPFPDITSSNFHLRSAAEREALNLPIQGSQADILKIAMRDLAHNLKKAGLKTRLMLTVHDELVLECPTEELTEAASILQKSMVEAVELVVPTVVNLKSGSNWSDLSPLTD